MSTTTQISTSTSLSASASASASTSTSSSIECVSSQCCSLATQNLDSVLDTLGEGIILDCDSHEEAQDVARKERQRRVDANMTDENTVSTSVRYTYFSIDTLEQENWYIRI